MLDLISVAWRRNITPAQRPLVEQQVTRCGVMSDGCEATADHCALCCCQRELHVTQSQQK